ncbi:phosphatase and actin regulator 2 [Trichonephila clavipes]|nr:phosphatase and actin regulator 2 [Trichonephila clavipes]
MSIIREKCSDIVLCKKVNGAMKTSSVNFNSRSPMKTKQRRFAMLRRIFQPWQWKRRKKRDRFEQTSRTLARKISMRSSKEELVKKDVLMPDGTDKDQDSKINDYVHPSVLSSSQNHAMPVKHVFLLNLPDVEEVPSHDEETVYFSRMIC